ncbi:class A rhodopsin-like G-protein coupled receptor GPRtak2, putative [Pediculus humanus corporis]|uniref:Class A rhodopsin-like G-protein coupled receptor GPRtak2, putative n=1 Tax=Pediculus humanus subsp. corporis TaxID=121224 RepID=E0VU74_PEDHC|nr:class A rhodopsin-like G-protein coupled receptor GPRtak2, putative [Pediculus humanus corporis]EEB16930.1 class A rhodopsin-like G-protein coupled receptor GPRtak2, putative [Pediculus humanus corporis]
MNVSADFNKTSVYEFLQDVLDGKNQYLTPEMKKKATDFVTNCVLPPKPFDLIWWQKLIWTSVFAVMLLVATGGNIIVMWIVLGKFTCTFFS